MNPKGSRLPPWASRPFHSFFENMHALDDVLHLSQQGIRVVTTMPRTIEVLAETAVDPHEKQDYNRRLARAEKEAALARKEVDSDFQLLHAQAVVSIWSALESLMKDLLVAWLVNQPAAWDPDPVARIRIPLAAFQRLLPEERASFVVETLERDAGAALKQGVGRFDAVLSLFGIPVVLEDKDRRVVLEMSQVRHCLAHRSGVADKRLLDGCPWLELKIGDRVRISHGDFHRYHHAGLHVGTSLIASCYEKLGLGPRSDLLGPPGSGDSAGRSRPDPRGSPVDN